MDPWPIVDPSWTKKDLSSPNISTGITQGIFRSFCVFGNSIGQHTASKLLVLTMTHILVPLATAIWLPRGQIGVYYWWNSITRLILITAFSQLLNQRPPRALQQGWVVKPGQATNGVWIGNLLIQSERVNALGYFPIKLPLISSPKVWKQKNITIPYLYLISLANFTWASLH